MGKKKQLKMYWLPTEKPKELELPEGYSFSNYKTEEDKLAWVECCKNGLVADDATAESFDNAITKRTTINLERDVFFLDYNGEHIGTFTAFKEENGCGDLHMVGIRTEHRGKGLAKYMNNLAVKHFIELGVPYAELTTDEWRKGAVRGYIKAGFRPVRYSHGMKKRWTAVMADVGIDSVQMLKNNTKPYKVIYADKK